jgi:hypothetical protein
MLWSSVVYETGFADYYDWDFQLLSRRERKTFMTHPKSNHLAQKWNQIAFRQTFADKIEFNARFPEQIGREWLDVRSSSVAQLEAFITKHSSVMVKIPDSMAGIGIHKRELSSITDFSALREELIANGQFLVEQFIEQHPTMASLCPTSVNSLRVITFFNGDTVGVLASVLKVGNGGDIDNYSNGGMYTMLDGNGVANYAAFDGAGAVHSVHPLTGVSIVGFEVPMYDRVLALVDRMSRIIPEVPYVGWDIAITPTEPIVIEGNPASGVYQLKPSATGVRTGLLPHYREVIGF